VPADGAGPQTAAVLDDQVQAARLADASIAARVAALEGYTAEVRKADAAYLEPAVSTWNERVRAEHQLGGDCSCGMIEGRFAELIAGQRQGVLVTLRKDGWPQLSNVNYAWYAGEQTIKISTTDDRAKTRNVRRDPRVSFHVTSGDFWSYVVVDGHAELSAVARDPHDAAVEELIDLYRAVQGEHPDWDDYRAAMVRDRRLVVRLRAERGYGMVHRG
jgi:PPOX class probable F420-dependent enzyme